MNTLDDNENLSVELNGEVLSPSMHEARTTDMYTCKVISDSQLGGLLNNTTTLAKNEIDITTTGKITFQCDS